MKDERLKEIEAQAKSPVTHELIAEVRRLQGIVEGVRAAVWDGGRSKASAPVEDSGVDAATMIDTVLSGLTEDAPQREFLESLKGSLEKYGRLTPKQAAALSKFYQNAQRRLVAP